jgi:hypothetical protein
MNVELCGTDWENLKKVQTFLGAGDLEDAIRRGLQLAAEVSEVIAPKEKGGKGGKCELVEDGVRSRLRVL